MFLGIVVFLFLLAIFDLVVGVSNDAVNFMNSAIGAKAASFKTIIAIAAFGIFIGATPVSYIVGSEMCIRDRRHTEQRYDGNRTARYFQA